MAETEEIILCRVQTYLVGTEKDGSVALSVIDPETRRRLYLVFSEDGLDAFLQSVIKARIIGRKRKKAPARQH